MREQKCKQNGWNSEAFENNNKTPNLFGAEIWGSAYLSSFLHSFLNKSSWNVYLGCVNFDRKMKSANLSLSPNNIINS